MVEVLRLVVIIGILLQDVAEHGLPTIVEMIPAQIHLLRFAS